MRIPRQFGSILEKVWGSSTASFIAASCLWVITRPGVKCECAGNGVDPDASHKGLNFQELLRQCERRRSVHCFKDVSALEAWQLQGLAHSVGRIARFLDHRASSPSASKSVEDGLVSAYESFLQEYENWVAAPLEGSTLCVGVYRNFISQHLAYSLLSPSNVSALAVELKKRGVASVLDPLAGTGFEAMLLTRAGVTVRASDAVSPVAPFHTVHRLDAVEAVLRFNQGEALLLAWPPSSTNVSEDTLRAFSGNHVVFIGDDGTWNGTPAFHSLLQTEWAEVWRYNILQWPHIKDRVRLFERVKRS